MTTPEERKKELYYLIEYTQQLLCDSSLELKQIIHEYGDLISDDNQRDELKEKTSKLSATGYRLYDLIEDIKNNL